MTVDGDKGQLISKANCQAVNSSKKRAYEFFFTSMRRVFICFLEEIEGSKEAFRNFLTFSQKTARRFFQVFFNVPKINSKPFINKN